MLPALQFKTVSLGRTVVAAVTALSIGFTAAPALAWGQRERDTLTGAVGALVIQSTIQNSRQRYQQPAPVYRAPPPPEPVYQAPRYYQEPVYQPRYEPRRQHHQPQSVSIYATPAAQVFNSYSSRERRMIQRRLAGYGYYRGGIDGSFGSGTYSAITAYANAQGQGRDLRSTNTAYAVFDGLLY